MINIPPPFENLFLRSGQLREIEGALALDPNIFSLFLNAPHDIASNFHGPPNVREKNGRGKDHPRYGRFIYAFAMHHRPRLVVEVGSFAGGTAVGWARAMNELGSGKVVCVDNDTYSKNTYPMLTRENILRTGFPETRLELLNGDSRAVIPELAARLRGTVDCYLVDGDHTYEGALADMQNGLPMLARGGFMLVHDVDTTRPMMEQTPEHPHPVHEAFLQVARDGGYEWCILKFIRKHLGILRVG